MVSLSDKIIKKLRDNALKDVAVVIDGAYLMSGSKMVYVRYQNDETNKAYVLDFYTRDDRSSNGRKKSTDTVDGALEIIRSKLTRNSIGKVQLENPGDVDMCRITLCDNLRLLIIESQLYSYVRDLIEKGGRNTKTFDFNGQILTHDQVTAICDAFEEDASVQYAKLVYSVSKSRFVDRIQKADKFYATEKAFIPVFVDYKNVYNPLLHDPSILNSEIYYLAKEKNRFIQIDNLSGYMLTHKEICQCLGMDRFMRFTPAFLYRLIVGLIHSKYSYFPNTNEMRILNTADNSDQQILTVEAYQKKCNSFKAIVESNTLPEDAKEKAKARLEELSRYATIDSLEAEVIENFDRLTHIGSFVLDDRKAVTPQLLYSIVKKANLVMHS